jgi:CAP12/Pycsar effector protein, TIR domain
MEKPKPRVFIGASSEARRVVDAVVASLKDIVVCNPWFLPNFSPTQATLSEILGLPSLHDFGLFIMSPDDDLVSRDQRFAAARDNVLIELGVFLGSVGDNRTFILLQQSSDPDKQMKVPSDLLGINTAMLRSTPSDDIATACYDSLINIRQKILSLQFRHEPFSVREKWGFDPSKKIWYVKLADSKLERNQSGLQNRKLILVAMVNNTSDFEDQHIAVSKEWKFSPLARNVKIECRGSILDSVVSGNTIESFLFLLPKEADTTRCNCINDFIAVGGRYLERPGQTVHFE